MPAAPDPHRPYYRVDPRVDRYIPNQIPTGDRWLYVALSLFILGWGAYGLWADDLIVPVNKRGTAVHFHGTSAVIMFCAMVAAALNLLAIVVDHFDIRNNELTYRRFAFVTQVAGVLLFAAALLVRMAGRSTGG